MIWCKWHEHGRDRLLAGCSEELLGKTVEGFAVYERFYKGKLVTEEEFGEMLAQCTIANLVGKRVIKIAKEKGFVQEKSVKTVGGFPHAQFVRMLKNG